MGKRFYNPEKLLHLFVQILDDLSFSRTFYPNRSVRVYLNGLAQQIFFKIYKNRKSRIRRFFTFWREMNYPYWFSKQEKSFYFPF